MNRSRLCFAIAVFGSLLLPGILNSGIVPLEMTSIYADFGLDEMKFGIVAGGVTVAAVILGITAAWAVPRFGAYRTCLAGYGLVVLGLIGTSLASVGVAALGLGVCLAWGMAYLHLANGLAVQFAPRRAATMTNLLHGINSLGKAAGPLFARIGVGWRPPFFALGCVAAVLLAVGLLGRAPDSQAAAADEPAEAPPREALRQPLFWLCAALFFPIVGMEVTVTTWLPRYLDAHAGLGPEAGAAAAETVALAMLWTMCGLRFLAPLLLRAIPPIVLLLVSAAAASGILLATEGDAYTGPQAIVGFLLCGLAFATPWPTFFALACGYFPRHKGLLSIASGAATSMAYIAFYALGGVLTHYAGAEWTLRIAPMLGVLFGAGACIAWRMGERKLALERSAQASG